MTRFNRLRVRPVVNALERRDAPAVTTVPPLTAGPADDTLVILPPAQTVPPSATIQPSVLDQPIVRPGQVQGTPITAVLDTPGALSVSTAPTVAQTTAAGNVTPEIRPAVTPGPVTGDFDGDGFVNMMDYRQFVRNYGASGAAAAPYDFDGNGVVDALDFAAFRSALARGFPLVPAVSARAGTNQGITVSATLDSTGALSVSGTTATSATTSAVAASDATIAPADVAGALSLSGATATNTTTGATAASDATIVPAIRVTGDFDGDGDVDMMDQREFMTHFGDTGAAAAPYDFDGNGVVDALDYGALRAAFGRPVPGTASG